MEVPQSLYMNCGCCSSREGFPQTTLNDAGTSVGTLRRALFSIKLDAMHLMLRIGQEMDPLPLEVLDRPELRHLCTVQG